MKISIFIAVLILAGAAFIVASRDRKMTTLVNEWEELKSESETYGVPTDPSIAYSPDRARAESNRRQQREKVNHFASRLIDFSNRMKAAQENGDADELRNSKEVAEIFGVLTSMNESQLKMLVAEFAESGELDDSAKVELMGFSIMMIASDNPKAALAIALESQDKFKGGRKERQRMLQMALQMYASKEPLAAADWLVENKDKIGEVDFSIHNSILAAVAGEDFSSAFQLMEKMEGVESRNALLYMTRSVTPERAEEFVAALRETDASKEEMVSAISSLANSPILEDFEKGSEWFENSSLTEEEKSTFTHSINFWSAKDQSSKWLGWILEQSTDQPSLTNKAESYVRNWARQDFVAAGEYIGGLPEGNSRNVAAMAYANTIAEHEPRAAADWAAALPDSPERVQLVEKIHRNLMKEDPAAAAELATKYRLQISEDF